MILFLAKMLYPDTLTPTLSQRERVTKLRDRNSSVFHPLPPGEGRGEGNRNGTRSSVGRFGEAPWRLTEPPCRSSFTKPLSVNHPHKRGDLLWTRTFLSFLLLVLILTLFPGCMAYEEAQYNMDFVIGSGYTPPINKGILRVPRRILMLPVTGAIDDRYKREFTNNFRSILNNEAPWTVVDWPDGSLGPSKLNIMREEATEMAQRLQCDAVLFVRMEDASLFPPLRQCIRYTLEEVGTGQVIVSAFQDYDTNNKAVANSARSFYQTNQYRQLSPDKSLLILSSNPIFLKYVAFASADSLKKALESSVKSTTCK